MNDITNIARAAEFKRLYYHGMVAQRRRLKPTKPLIMGMDRYKCPNTATQSQNKPYKKEKEG